MTTNPSQLFLLADHIKLSLLERQRAISLNLEPSAHDGQISRSLQQLESGIEALEQSEDESLHTQLPLLRSQYNDLSAQFSGSTPLNPSTLTSPNDASLESDFSAARSRPSISPSRLKSPTTINPSKSVRFRDAPSPTRAQSPHPSGAALFPYRDDPTSEDVEDPTAHLDNQQIHAYHASVLREQDEQLDLLGASIGRQRELSIAIGNELDDHAMLLDEVDEGIERHMSQLDRAKGKLNGVGRKAKENWSAMVIVILIIILVLLIVITK
ncbi:hypothetical protein M501DRAFT_988403 [Patellaria atrata CBS 101060]|uniref:t-SNARE coiled-coil homology domain-containing protein n=1 Tax=Patellaria atrata CBS 101060 TaxID=1346257 RepID=A0A9P4VUM6_9PEZI|nr:hypothetical protein M501DRAFT_988403 [Patellaria atrata CBS 101060]